MARKRLATGIPREWTPHTAEVLEDELTRIYSRFDQLPLPLVGLGNLSLTPGALLVGSTTGSGGFTSVAFDSTPQRVLTNGGAGVPAWTQVSLTLGVTGTLPATNGGTGVATVAVGDLLYGSATNVWSKLAKNATATRYLSNTGAANIPAWAQIDLSNGVTGTLADTHLSANVPLLNAAVNAFTQNMTIGGTLDVTGVYKAGGTSGVATFGPAPVVSITVKNGLVVAIA